MVANFVEVWLAKEGHAGRVGLNLLTKVQMPNLASLYGAMLAGVDVVIMGGGIPREIPGVLDALARHGVGRMRFDMEGDAPDNTSALRSLTPLSRARPPKATRAMWLANNTTPAKKSAAPV